jgi:hypothetical protein
MTYTFASHNYLILEQGGGMSMFAGVPILQNDGMLDVELLERYIIDNLSGHIGEKYREVRNSITPSRKGNPNNQNTKNGIFYAKNAVFLRYPSYKTYPHSLYDRAAEKSANSHGLC